MITPTITTTTIMHMITVTTMTTATITTTMTTAITTIIMAMTCISAKAPPGSKSRACRKSG